MRLSHTAVLAPTAAQLRGLRMLSLVFGSELTNASVAAIASSYPNLELFDLSRPGISDSGIGMICNIQLLMEMTANHKKHSPQIYNI